MRGSGRSKWLFSSLKVLDTESWSSTSAVMAEEAAAEEKPSVLDSLSGAPADVLEKMKGMTLMEAAELTKEAEKVFGLVDDDDDEAPAEE
mmetsp:Transcript_11889/g.27029  ORF Transcript_11889/g.27029 Transcript_11889/m.27029 type:complete len:90 (-) Transcript_11889:153-422(-)